MIEWKCALQTWHQGRFGLLERNQPAVPRGCESEFE
jgi:hypothetical protein